MLSVEQISISLVTLKRRNISGGFDDSESFYSIALDQHISTLATIVDTRGQQSQTFPGNRVSVLLRHVGGIQAGRRFYPGAFKTK